MPIKNRLADMQRAGAGRLHRFPRTTSVFLPGLMSLQHRGTEGGRSPSEGPPPTRREKIHPAAASDKGRK